MEYKRTTDIVNIPIVLCRIVVFIATPLLIIIGLCNVTNKVQN